MSKTEIPFNEQRGASNSQLPIANSGNVERRAFNTIFKRMDGEGDDDKKSRTVEGYAAVFNSTTTIGNWYDEVIESGAFDDAIAVSDCRALFNHDPNHLLARQSSGTLKLELDSTGLKYRFDMPEHREDLLEMMERGDLKESSFAFTVKEESWEEKKQDDGKWKYTRRIKKVEMLYDVSPVTYPAYADTSVAKRSLDAWVEAHRRATQTETQPQPTPPAGVHIDVLRAVFG